MGGVVVAATGGLRASSGSRVMAGMQCVYVTLPLFDYVWDRLGGLAKRCGEAVFVVRRLCSATLRRLRRYGAVETGLCVRSIKSHNDRSISNCP